MVTFVMGIPVEAELCPPGKLVMLIATSSAAPQARMQPEQDEYTSEAAAGRNAGVSFRNVVQGHLGADRLEGYGLQPVHEFSKTNAGFSP